MTLNEILQSLRNNGKKNVATIVERMCGNDKIEEMYGDVITGHLYEDCIKPPTPEDIILSPEFAMLRSVAVIMASYMPVVEIEIELT